MSSLGNAWMLMRSWLTCKRLPFHQKLVYPLRLVECVLRRRKQIRFLDRNILVDNPRTPLVLLRYPKDVATHLLGNLDGPISTVLDIGGNIGQFSLTLSYFHPDLEALDVFEANPELFQILRSNLDGVAQVFPFGIGVPGKRDFFFVPEASGVGSLSSERASYKGRRPRKICAQLLAEVQEVTGRSRYDLTKIDVEGAELEVLRNLKVQTKFMWLELSGCKKPGIGYLTSEVYRALEEGFGAFDVLYQSEWRADTICDLLVKFQT